MYSGILLEFLNMGGGEIALIMVAILLLFGGKKLPELARGLGKGIREFKDASEGVKREIHRNINAVDIENELKDDDKNDNSATQPNADVEENHSERHHPTEEPSVPAITEDQNPITTEVEIKEKSNTKENKETEL